MVGVEVGDVGVEVGEVCEEVAEVCEEVAEVCMVGMSSSIFYPFYIAITTVTRNSHSKTSKP
jgi:hypothetical protein